ncbi:unnamed protein product [Chondrus crispus]|uniref:ER-derived vesicles protein ERV14 n=1 Tax=Chondrus crispus TaxID=2769 RepID=S0F347_CHOCR|nr:unnamed protein product [Chondrus crispus]CDF77387.1 unnamed protein product [Chondrus crispus]|eukprot:XP_005712261.1 unnamed protein product [Chondrus crispus]
MGLIAEVLFWSSVFLGTAGLLFCAVYALILFSDLTADHINPVELCELINRLVLPEYLGHVALTAVLLLKGLLIPAVLNLPLILFHTWRYRERKHLLDNTSIFNDVEKERPICVAKLAHHLLMFFIYLYFFIIALAAA